MMFGPRFAILVWWLMDSTRWQLTFSSFFMPLLGFIFLPWTTLSYVAVAPGGVVFFDWIIIGLGLAVDITSYSSGVYGRQHRYVD